VSDRPTLLASLEDIVYSYQVDGHANCLVDELYEFILDTYGPPFHSVPDVQRAIERI